jgi:hypothetical protein
MAAWFSLSAAVAWRRAWQGRYAAHARWMMRHAASGLSVSLMRVFVYLLCASGAKASTEEQRADNFGYCMVAAWWIMLAGTELWLWRRDQQAAPRKAAGKAA